jgi:SH3-like domain-containing protein
MERVYKTMLIALLLLAALAVGNLAAEKMMSVSVKETPLRATPTFMGRIVTVLHYTDRVEVLEERSGWARVSLSGAQSAQGWVHMSALSRKNIVLQAGDSNVRQSASSGEVALAGKGFNEQVEAQYKQQNNLDYTVVDQMEQVTVSMEEILLFVEEGALILDEGEAQ